MSDVGALGEYRDPSLAQAFAREIRSAARRPARRTHARVRDARAPISRASLRSLLPDGVRLIRGPGVPRVRMPRAGHRSRP
ncbi:MAG: hypothetical protein MZU95_00495 [Desulfomicrobium escambiense]|nr:hypothetical protein [Desulfomicrobium escambiense]